MIRIGELEIAIFESLLTGTALAISSSAANCGE
jgi:hypothetical protein